MDRNHDRSFESAQQQRNTTEPDDPEGLEQTREQTKDTLTEGTIDQKESKQT